MSLQDGAQTTAAVILGLALIKLVEKLFDKVMEKRNGSPPPAPVFPPAQVPDGFNKPLCDERHQHIDDNIKNIYSKVDETNQLANTANTLIGTLNQAVSEIKDLIK